MADHVFPQHGDFPDAASIAQLIGHKAVSGFVDEGMDITVDFGVPEFDVSAGKAYIRSPSYDTETPQIDPKETRDGVGFVVEFDGATGVPLTDDDECYVYLDANIGVDDSPKIVTNTTGSKPTPESIKIGQVNTASDIKNETNRASPASQTSPRNIKVFTSGQEFSAPDEASRITAILIGGGGGGGGAGGPGGGGGGGGGGSVEVVTLPQQGDDVVGYEILVGAGGNGRAGEGGFGAGDSVVKEKKTFGSFADSGVTLATYIAQGGEGGGYGAAEPDGGTGGPPSEEDDSTDEGAIVAAGDAGGAGTPQESGARAMSGKGGDSMYGGGGAGKAIGSSSTSTKAGADGNGFGGGGSGGVIGGGASSGEFAAGGNGAGGVVIFMW